MPNETTDFLSKVGERVRELRKRKDWTLKDVSEATGLHPSSISQVERGERNLTLRNLSKLAEGLDVKPHQFLLTLDRDFSAERNEEQVHPLFENLPEEKKELIYEIAGTLLEWETNGNRNE